VHSAKCLVARRFWWIWVMDDYVTRAEEKTASERANAQPQQRAVVVAYLYSIVRHCSPSRCGGRAAGIPPIVVVEMPHGITIATSRPCGAAFVAELPHL